MTNASTKCFFSVLKRYVTVDHMKTHVKNDKKARLANTKYF